MTENKIGGDATVYVVQNDKASLASTCDKLGSWGLKTEAFATGEDFLQNASGSRPGCLLVDHEIGDMKGADLMRWQAARGEQMPVVVLCDHPSVSLAVEYMTNGAHAVLETPFQEDKLRQELHRAIESDTGMVEVEQRYRELRQLDGLLEDRERIVLEGVLTGKLNKAIANQLEVSVRTVETLRSRVYAKYRVDSAAELACKFTELRMLADLYFPASEPRPSVVAPTLRQHVRKAGKLWSSPIPRLLI